MSRAPVCPPALAYEPGTCLPPGVGWSQLASRVQAAIERSALPCHGSVDIVADLPEPQAPIAALLCTAFEEMLLNVVQHARATEVLVRLRATPIDITLLVKDNGRGAPPSAFDQHGAGGVIAMRRTASRLGGWLQIDSQPGGGTQLILSLPMSGRPSLAR